MKRFLSVTVLLLAGYAAGRLHEPPTARASRRAGTQAASVPSARAARGVRAAVGVRGVRPAPRPIGREAVADAPPAPLEVPVADAVVLEPARHEFERWYAVHRVWLGLPGLERNRLQDFHRDVIEPLGRVPRVEFLLPLLEGYAALGDDDAWLAVAARTLGPADLRLLWFSDPWEEARERIKALPRALGRSGLEPYACADAMLEAGDFARWYLVYGPGLGLAPCDREFLEELGERLVGPLDRVPRPSLLRVLVDLWAARDAERALVEQRSDSLTAEAYNAARDVADRRLRDALRRVLHPLDWKRIRHSGTWRALFFGLE